MKIIKESHVDHGLTKSQIAYIENVFRNKKAFFIETIDLSDVGLGTVPCGLHGPCMGDGSVDESDVSYIYRNGRPNSSRCVDRPEQMTSKVTVIAGPHKDEETGEEYSCVLYTAFGGPLAPKEPDDPAMKIEELDKSKAFWAEHALTWPKCKNCECLAVRYDRAGLCEECVRKLDELTEDA